MKQSIKTTITFIIAFGMVACTQVFWLLAWGKHTFAFLSVMAVLLTLVFSAVTIVNAYVLIPRLLLRNRYVAYALSILGFVLVSVSLDLFTEYWLIKHYHIEPSHEWTLSHKYWMLLPLLSSLTSYFIAFAGTGILFFLHLWNQSGKHLEDLKKQNTHNELQRVRTQIDSQSLLSTLDKAANQVIQSPAKVTSLFMNLSKSLRMQLYESRQKQHTAHLKAQANSFNASYSILNLLTEKRYRVQRHLLLVMWFASIVVASFEDYSLQSFLTVLTSLLVYLIMVYLNIYMLIPKLMMRGKKIAYFVSAFSLFLTALVLLILAHLIDTDILANITPWFIAFFTVSNTVKLCFPIYGVISIRLFQQWVRNQRRISKLETATMLSELEQLQNQVNPHFLFNMLNNIIVLTKTNPDEAAVVIHKLSDMLKYQFHGFAQQCIRLGDDIHFLMDYLNLEKLRRDHFEFSITEDKGVEDVSLPPLLFIPFVENAVKHGNDNRSPSFIHLHFGLADDTFRFSCVNSKPMNPVRRSEVGGLGLPNVRRRLRLLFGNRHHLEMTETEKIYLVELEIKLK